MARSRRYLAASVIAVALTAACTSQDADRDDVIASLEDAGVDTEQAECVGDGLEGELSQGQLNDVRDADDLDDLGNELQTTVDSVLNECLGDGGGDEGSDSTDDETTTTEAESGG